MMDSSSTEGFSTIHEKVASDIIGLTTHQMLTANTKHLYNIYTMLVQRRRRRANVV